MATGRRSGSAAATEETGSDDARVAVEEETFADAADEATAVGGWSLVGRTSGQNTSAFSIFQIHNGSIFYFIHLIF